MADARIEIDGRGYSLPIVVGTRKSAGLTFRRSVRKAA